ncbi:hypothetical protein BT93_H0712 [Corymbia citriodora subsp. variegata]|nr:hypothetical protein BT93_H0712 [Corymbia citriodora subsp. variegata]
MTDLHAIPPRPDNNPASPGLRLSDQCKATIFICIVGGILVSILFYIFISLLICAEIRPELQFDLSSSLSSVNVSSSRVTGQWNMVLSIKRPSKVAVEYAHMNLLLSYGQLSLSRPALIPDFIQSPGNVTTVRAEAPSMIQIVNDLSVRGLVRSLKRGEVAIDVVVKSKRRIQLGLLWVPVPDMEANCNKITFTAPTDGKGGSWMSLGGTLDCRS